jgi:tetratricopeptide (TPR) repeat protein
MTLRLLPAALAALVAAGCMQTTVKPTERRVLTPEEVAESDARRKQQKGEDAAAQKPPEPPPPAPGSAAEIEHFRAESAKAPADPKWHFLLGRAYETQNPPKLELAEIRYREGGRLIAAGQYGNDAYTGPHYYLGRVLFKENKFAEALAELKRAVDVKPLKELGIEAYYLNPDYRESYHLIGQIQYHLKNITDSEDAFKLFLKYGGERDRVVTFFPQLIAE